MSFSTFVNCRICRNGKLVQDQMVVSEETGRILPRTGYIGGEAIDLEDRIIAPGYLELQTNGLLGFHFTNFETAHQYASQLEKVSKHFVTRGVTGFWATIPTVATDKFKKVLPCLRPRVIENSAELLGAHAEGPYLHPSKHGAHDPSLFQIPRDSTAEEVYGEDALKSSVKLVTLAPEQPGSSNLIAHLRDDYQIRVSMGHSSASYEMGLQGIKAGATALTHTFNAMNPLDHRSPGLVGLISSYPEAPYYSIIADGIHLHPAAVALAYRANPSKCMLITDSIELTGLPDGIYPRNAQVRHMQRKHGNRVTIESTNTLVGGCSSLDECIRNLMGWSGCSLAEAVQCATENIARFMGLCDRGRLEEGCRADFVVLSDDGEVLETWIGGKKIWERL